MEVAREYVDYILQPFENLSVKEREILMNTLFIYAINGGNLSKTSKECFLHRNTLIYRISKLREILKNNLNNPEDS
ncbi:MAG: helix-turn-helix domain-containing protein [Thermosediminibacteraceae bacterium]|nr:helix-turn-helix domain-containing protein [Thermosediminibacteraceae bacterium]